MESAVRRPNYLARSHSFSVKISSIEFTSVESGSVTRSEPVRTIRSKRIYRFKKLYTDKNA